MNTYTYTLLRYVHDIATHEFVTVGVVLHSSDTNFVGAKLKKSYGRIKDLFPGFESEGFRSNMFQLERAFTILGQQQTTELPLKKFKDALSVGTSVLPKDDSSLQWSAQGSGVTNDLQAELEALYARFVIYYDDKAAKRGRSDDQVWGHYRSVLQQRNLLAHLAPKTISTADDEFVFESAIKNGVWHCFEPVSLDLASKENIKDKAYKVLGRLTSMAHATEQVKLYLLLGAPQDHKLTDTFQHMVNLLQKTGINNEVLLEDQTLKVAEIIEKAASHSTIDA